MTHTTKKVSNPINPYFAIRQPKLWSEAAERFPDCDARIILTGSGAKPVAEAAGTPYIQEVVANSIALKKTYETVGTAIELGGQDAKIIFCDILPPLS